MTRLGLAAMLATLAFAAGAHAAGPKPGGGLPAGFVHLADVAPAIRQDMRYVGTDNFMRRPVAGYEVPACILTREAAEALATVQARLAAEDLSLVVFDCYRPERAVAAMVAWVNAGGPADPRWYPGVRRSDLIARGYVGRRSAHSRGSTVDLGIAPHDASRAANPACGAAGAGLLDFGTGFDCFSPQSATASRSVGKEASANRRRLVELMAAAGFRNYGGEWWHFTLRGEPFPKQRFDFPVR